MKTKKIKVRYTGTYDMLMHKDNLIHDPKVKKWRSVNKDSPRGDDRYPAWTFLGYIYEKDGVVGFDRTMLATNLSEGGKGVTKSGKKTYKEPMLTSFDINEDFVPIKVNGKPISIKELGKLMAEDNQDFDDAYIPAAEKLGLPLDVRRAKVGMNKHVRVRPVVPSGWTLEYTATVNTEEIPLDDLEQVFHIAGTNKGIGDWRPGAPKPGPFGRFEVTFK